jgi:hypothetical protein
MGVQQRPTLVFVALLSFVGILAPAVYHQAGPTPAHAVGPHLTFQRGCGCERVCPP